MARQFTDGVSTDGGGSPTANMATLQSTFRTIITANPAWSLVETINGSGNVVDVYKCAATFSGLPKDFYLLLQRAISNGNFTLHMGEDYNSSTHVLSNIAVSYGGSARAVDPSTGLLNPVNTITVNATTGNLSGGSNSLSFTLNGAATISYAIVVDSDHIVYRIGLEGRYAGAIESLVTAIPDPMPLVFMSLSGTAQSASANSGATRNPGLAAAGLANSHAITDMLFATNTLYPVSGVQPITVSDPWLGGPAAYEIGAVNPTGANVGNIRGRVKRMRKVLSLPVGTALGDTFTIGGKQWVVIGLSSTTAAALIDPGP